MLCICNKIALIKTTKMKKQSTGILDVIGISSASLCMVHCLIFPILSVFTFGFSNAHWIDILFACIGMFVVSKILISKTSKTVKLILFVSILTIINGVALEVIYSIETNWIVIGVLGMIIGHLFNYKSHSKKTQYGTFQKD
jgi:hypothetical protein